MDEKRKIIIEVAVGVVVLIIVIVLVVYAFHWNGGVVSNSNQSSSTTQRGGNFPGGLPGIASSVAPNKGATSTPANVAVPVVQGPGSPSGDVSYRSFNISIDGGAYSPSTVIVRQGDTVNLEMTAVDASYGFTLPSNKISVAIAKGKTQTIQFEALTTGDFTFYCASCGGPSRGPVGHLIVTAN